jgi:hypothetical protein
MGQLLSILWLLILLSFSGGVLASMVQSGRAALRIVDARETEKRLVKSTLVFFGGKRPPAGEAFWKEIGRPALLDPWKNPFEIEVPVAGQFRWRSRGPDGLRATADDIIVESPYGEHLLQEAKPETFLDASRPISRGAK